MRFVCVLLALCAACNQMTPDPRTADVVVRDAALLQPTHDAIEWWRFATRGEVRFRITDDCRPHRWCTTISFAALPAKTIGHCGSWWHRGRGGSFISIDFTVSEPKRQQQVIAHEFGHSIRLPHLLNDEDGIELMRPTVTDEFTCIGRGTQELYSREWGSTDLQTICGPFPAMSLPTTVNQ